MAASTQKQPNIVTVMAVKAQVEKAIASHTGQ
jgi:hypothetical protein